MLTGPLRNKVDALWTAFWTGGIANPLTVIEQITYLMFIKRLDEVQAAEDRKAQIGVPVERTIFSPEQQQLRWKNLSAMGDPQAVYRIMSEEVFRFLREMAEAQDGAFSKYMKNATFMIPTPRLLAQVMDMINEIDRMEGARSRDTKGDLYEYMLGKLSSAGQNGQFRTPRHIIKLMVEMVQPRPGDTICDPSMGSAGFLVEAGEYLRSRHEDKFRDKTFLARFNQDLFLGVEFDATMIRIGAMNLLLHGVEQPDLHDRDALGKEMNHLRECCTLILANPPFKGSLDYDNVAPDLIKTVKTKKTELLFLALMLKMLKIGGRAAVIVPDGVLFGSSGAHKDIRKELIDNQQLQAVISMPSGVFKPYAGVSTAILLFTKTDSGGTGDVLFYDMQADGFSLDDKRTPLTPSPFKDKALEAVVSDTVSDATLAEAEQHEIKHTDNNLPDILAKWQAFTVPQASSLSEDTGLEGQGTGHTVPQASSLNQHPGLEAQGTKSTVPQASSLNQDTGLEGRGTVAFTDRSAQAFTVPKSELVANDYDLSINRYKEIVYEAVEYDPPQEIIARIEALDAERRELLEALQEMIIEK